MKIHACFLTGTCAALCAFAPLAAADHGHGHGHGHDHAHGTAVELGTATIGAWSVEAEALGAISAGKEAVIELKITPATPKPVVARAWIGSENGRGSVKAKLEAEDEGFHGHLDVPTPLPADAKLWVSLDDASGSTVGSFALPAAK